MTPTKLYAVVDKDGEIMVAYPATQFHNQFSETLKELHTYNPATQVVIRKSVHSEVSAFIRCSISQDDSLIDEFLSAGKE